MKFFHLESKNKAKNMKDYEGVFTTMQQPQ